MGKIKKLKAKIRSLEATNVNLLHRLERLEKALLGDENAKVDIQVDIAMKNMSEWIGRDLEQEIVTEKLPILTGLSEWLPEAEPVTEKIARDIETTIGELELEETPVQIDEPILDLVNPIVEAEDESSFAELNDPPGPMFTNAELAEHPLEEGSYNQAMPGYDGNGSEIS